jgi:hypothetical protein
LDPRGKSTTECRNLQKKSELGFPAHIKARNSRWIRLAGYVVLRKGKRNEMKSEYLT